MVEEQRNRQLWLEAALIFAAWTVFGLIAANQYYRQFELRGIPMSWGDALRHGVLGVQREIEQRVLELVRVGMHRPEAGGEHRLDADLLAGHALLHQHRVVAAVDDRVRRGGVAGPQRRSATASSRSRTSVRTPAPVPSAGV